MSSGKGKQKKMYWEKRKNRRRGKECHDKGTQLIFVKCSEQCMTHKIYQSISVAQSCLTLYDPMDCSRPGLPVRHQLSEFTQTHVFWVGDATQPSHPLLSLSPPAFNLSSNRSFQVSQFITIGGQSIAVSSASVLPMNTLDWSPLGWTRWISL